MQADHRQLAGARDRQGHSSSATCSSTAAGRRSAALDGDEVARPDVGGGRSAIARRATDDMDREVLATGARARGHGDDAGPDGEEITFLVVKFPLRDADGQTYGVCTIATDITERRRSAEERAELEARLAQAQRLESRRPARRRRRARLQQPAVGDPDLRRLRPARAARRPPGARRRRGDRPRARTAPRRSTRQLLDVQPPRGRHAARSSTSPRSCATSSGCSSRTLVRARRAADRRASPTSPRCSPTARSSSRCS